MNHPSTPPVVSRRALIFSGGLVAVLLLALAAFLGLRGRTEPLWVTRHATTPPATP